MLDAGGRPLCEVVENSPSGLARLVGALSTLGRAWRVEQVLGSSAARDLRAGVGVRMLGDARADGSRASLGEPEKDDEGRWRIAPGEPWCVNAVNRSDVPIYANFVLVFPDGRIVVPCPPCPDDRIQPGGAATRCAPAAFEIAAEPVRLYCVWTPRWHEFSALAQSGFSIERSPSQTESWSLSDFAFETWVCSSTELAVR